MNKLFIKYNEKSIETIEEYYYLNKNNCNTIKVIKLEVKPIINTKRGLILYVDTSPSMDGEILYRTRKRLERLTKARLLDKIEVYSWCNNVKGPSTLNQLKICEGSNLEKTLKHALLRSSETGLDPVIITDFEVTSGTKNKKKLCKIISELKNLKHEPLFLVNKTNNTDQEIYTYLKEKCSALIYELDPEYVDAQALLLSKRVPGVPIDIRIDSTMRDLGVVAYLETPIYWEKYKLTRYIFLQEKGLIGVRIVLLEENRNTDTGIARIYLHKTLRLDEIESLTSIVV